MVSAGLIIEGGGMRGVYSAGILDFFLDQNLEFSSVYGVSAGATPAAIFRAKEGALLQSMWITLRISTIAACIAG